MLSEHDADGAAAARGPGVTTEGCEALRARFPQLEQSAFRGQQRLRVPADLLRPVWSTLKQELGFDLLVDITCVDYLQYRGARQRFGLVYILCNTVTGERLTLRVMLDEPQLQVPSAVPFWEGANWLEREVWDLFGIRFVDHPDLRRLVLPEEFTSHPLRKDYPLQGRGERHNFPVLTRGEA